MTFDDLRREHAAKNPEGHFFDHDTEKANQAQYHAIYTTPCDGSTVFFVDSVEHTGERFYKLRAMDRTTGQITTIGNFDRTLQAARSRAEFVSGAVIAHHEHSLRDRVRERGIEMER